MIIDRFILLYFFYFKFVLFNVFYPRQIIFFTRIAMEVKIEIVESDHAYATSTVDDILLKYADNICNGNNSGGSHTHIGKGYNNNNNNNNNNNVIDILDLAVPQSKVRPIDRLLDRYDWSSASMTPQLQDADRLQRAPYDQPLSHCGRLAPLSPRRPPAPIQPPPPSPPPQPPTRPPRRCALDFSDRTPPIRKSLWKRARELMSSCFVRAVAAAPKVVCF